MMRSMHAFVALFILFFLSLPISAQQWKAVPPDKVGMSAERLQRLTEVLNGYVNDGKLAGAVALVARHGKVAYVKAVGYRDVESKSPMTDDRLETRIQTPAGEKWLGSPAQPDKQTKRQILAIQRLPELLRRVMRIEKKLGLNDETSI